MVSDESEEVPLLGRSAQKLGLPVSSAGFRTLSPLVSVPARRTRRRNEIVSRWTLGHSIVPVSYRRFEPYRGP